MTGIILDEIILNKWFHKQRELNSNRNRFNQSQLKDTKLSFGIQGLSRVGPWLIAVNSDDYPVAKDKFKTLKHGSNYSHSDGNGFSVV